MPQMDVVIIEDDSMVVEVNRGFVNEMNNINIMDLCFF